MSIGRLIEEIKKLNPKQKEELFHKLGVIPSETEKEELRGGTDRYF